MGRNRTLLGTKLIPLRISSLLLAALDELAGQEGVSRNTLISRILASYMLKQQKPDAE